MASRLDNVTNRTFNDLFSAKARFIIPFFQRGYAWQKRQWDDLFIDISEHILGELDEGTPISEIEHFFGPIVVQSIGVNESGIEEYLVIDGQQRITTVYLLLGLIKQALASKQHLAHEASGYVQDLHGLLTNPSGPGDDYARMKVFSGKGDRLPTYRVVFGDEITPQSPYYETDVRLYRPGNNQVENFRDYANKKLKKQFADVPSLWQLANALLNCLTVVWIPLDQDRDDAQAIFESLNDKGMPLSASELLCSYLFRPLMASDDFEHLHNSQWLKALHTAGDRETFEEFLRYYFSIGENKMVGKGRRVYVHFKARHRNLASPVARRVLAEVLDGTTAYQFIAAPNSHLHPDKSLRDSLQAISHTRMEASTPFLLAILRAVQNGTLSIDRAKSMLRETVVQLVRRKVTERPTTIYDTLFPNLLGRIINEPNCVQAIHDQFRKYGVWTSDQELREAFVKQTLYRSRDLVFTRYVLRELDRSLQEHGQFPDYSTIDSIEHVLPQELTPEWRTYLGADAKSDNLWQALHTVGNLLLVSAGANSSVGQDPFESKRASYATLSALARRIKDHSGPWNIASIRSNSTSLAEQACAVWKWSDDVVHVP